MLASKYKNTLNIKKMLPALLEMMVQLHVKDRAVFEMWMWLAAERCFLEPLKETLQMEYYQKLVNLADHE